MRTMHSPPIPDASLSLATSLKGSITTIVLQRISSLHLLHGLTPMDWPKEDACLGDSDADLEIFFKYNSRPTRVIKVVSSNDVCLRSYTLFKNLSRSCH